MSFSLYRRPGGVVFLDDDSAYLEMLADVMPPEWHVRLFLQPRDCIEQLLQEVARWEHDAWQQQQIINRWRDGGLLIPQILQYWREDGSARFGLTQVCVVDYSMPSMSGLRFLSELKGWQGSRILLTGRADEQIALSAFNRGLIEQFIPKQSQELRSRLCGAIEDLMRTPDPRQQQTWRATLSPAQHALLCSPGISHDLEQLALQQGWIEHVVIGAPFGVLALNAQGAASWLQLEPAENLPELAEIAQSQGWDAATLAAIRSGEKLMDLELQLALGAGTPAQPRHAFSMSDGQSLLYAALFAVSETFSPDVAQSHAYFIASHGNRNLLG